MGLDQSEVPARAVESAAVHNGRSLRAGRLSRIANRVTDFLRDTIALGRTGLLHFPVTTNGAKR